MTLLGKRTSLPIIPGVNPLEDATELDTIFFTNADKIRFQNGKLRKILGWQRAFSINSQRITGAARNIFSFRDALNNAVTMVGTSDGLYAILQDQTFYNVTPLLLATNAIPNAFATEYNAAVNVDVTTTVGSNVVTLAITNYLNANETITIAGVSGSVNGIPAAAFNTESLTMADTNNEQVIITLSGSATSSGTVSVTMTWSTSYVYAAISNNGLTKGNRIGITLSGDVANITAANINKEQIVSNVVDSSVFVFQTGVTATSSVSAAGGSDTLIQYQVPDGYSDQSQGFGYGGGIYGGTLGGAANPDTRSIYGNPLPFTTKNSFPRIWSMDKWTDTNGGDYLVLTPGDIQGSADQAGSNLYIWPIQNIYTSIVTAPVLITATPAYGGAPMFVKWVYTSNNFVCTLGGAPYPESGPAPSQGDPNYFASSDVGQVSSWTPGPGSFAFETYVDQAGALISQASTRDRDLIFTEDEVYQFQFVGKPNIWFISKLMATDGIMAPKARTEIEDAVFWMGKGDFFVFDGTSTVSVLPNNTLKRYVYDNLNQAQYGKCFAYANTAYNEVWFFYASNQELPANTHDTDNINSQNEPNHYVMFNYKDKNWATGTLPRTAAEEPFNITSYPYMIESNLYTSLYPVSVQSYFFTLDLDPLSTVIFTDTVSLEVVTNTYFTVGDYINISGATSVGGIDASYINGIQVLTAVSIAGTIQTLSFDVDTSATSSATGGGAAVAFGTAIVGFDIGSPRITAAEVISILGAPSVGGIPQNNINASFISVRSLQGTVIQINNSAPTTVFSTSQQTIANTSAPLFFILYSPSDRLFQQENGLNGYNVAYVMGLAGSDSNAPIYAYAETNMAQIDDGDEMQLIYSVYPDTNQAQNISLTVSGRLYAQSPVIYPNLGGTNGVYTITPTTRKVDIMMIARQRRYRIESYAINGNFLIGNWYEERIISTPR